MIPFANPKIDEATIKRVAAVLRSGKVSNGKYCRELEERVKEISGAEYAVAVNSCTTGLWLVQKELGFFKKKHGLWEKKIACPAFTWKSTYWNLKRPVWMDCDIDAWNVTRIPKADGAMVTQVFGNRATDVAWEEEIPVVADSAHALGLLFGCYYTAEVYSLAPSKTFTGTEGGVVVTNDAELAGKLSDEVKWAGRLEEANAVIALAQLQDWKKKLEEKLKIAHAYAESLPFLKFQKCDNCRSTHNEVGFTSDNYSLVAECKQALNRAGIEFRSRYEPPAGTEGKCPNAWSVWRGNVNLPSWVGVDYKAIVKVLKDYYSSNKDFLIDLPDVEVDLP